MNTYYVLGTVLSALKAIHHNPIKSFTGGKTDSEKISNLSNGTELQLCDATGI